MVAFNITSSGIVIINSSIELVDITAFLFLIGLLSYYFGKIISDSEPLKEAKEVNYIRGILFIMIWIFLPFLLFYFILNQFINKIYLIITIFLFIIQILVLRYLHLKTQIRNSIIFNSYEEYKKKFHIYNSFWPKKLINFLIKDISFNQLYTINIINLFSTLIILKQDVNLLLKITSFFLFLLSISTVAELSVRKSFEIIVHQRGKKEYSARLIKIEDNFITILKDKKVFNIASDDILMLERKVEIH